MSETLATPTNRVERYQQRFVALKAARSPFDPHWRDIADYLLPRAPRFSPGSDRSRAGTKRNEKILRDDGGRALQIGTRGLMSGTTPATREWFGFATMPDPELMEFQPVKVWLERAQETLHYVFDRSNTYNTLYAIDEGNMAFGTAFMVVDDDPRQVIRTYALPIGSFCLASGPGLVVDTVYRECAFTVEQLVRRFGTENCSLAVRGMYLSGNLDALVPVIHAVQPRQGYDASRGGRLNMPWASCYFEAGGGDGGKALGESGFIEFPGMAARWNVIGEDVYGSDCPGMRALPDIKGLQEMEKRALNIAAKLANPPVVVPTDLENKPGAVNLLPGGTTFAEGNGPGKRVYPAHEIHADGIKYLEEKMGQAVDRIYGHFYADLFQLATRMDAEGEKATAAEVYARMEEKAEQLSAVLYRLWNETLTPLIDRTFNICLRQGLFPPIPRELAGVELKVEPKSALYQLQGSSAATGIANVVAFASQLAAELQRPEFMDKIDVDQSIDRMARTQNMPADCIRSDDDVAAIREQRAQEQQAMQAAEMAKAVKDGAGAAKSLSETDPQGGALGQILGAA